MADDNDDSWLYGAGQEESLLQEEKETEEEVTTPVKNGNTENKNYDTFDEHNFEEAGDHEQLIADDSKDGVEDGGTQGGDSDDSDDDDDDINVVIGDIKAGGTSNYVKNPQDKQKLPGSKFNIEEFETVGSINGQPAFEFAIENIEDKPWRKPGADITDYFNYGFNEETWRAYCERQKKMRIHESGVGLAGLTAAQNPQGNMEPRQGINIGIKRMGGPRQKPSGMIDVIGAPSQNPIRPPAPRENVIQVMTADRREYSRTVVGNPQNPQMPMSFNIPPEEFYNHEEQDAFNYGYEPTQDSQWESQNPGWAPSEIKELTGLNQPPPMMALGVPPPMMGGGMPPRMPMNMMAQPPGQSGMIPSLMSQVTTMPPSMKPSESRERRDRETRHYEESRKRPREKTPPREHDRKERERPRDDRSKYDRDARESRYRETSSRRDTRRSKSREKTKRSKSKEKSKRSRSKDRKADDKDKDRSRSDKSKRTSKKEES